MATADVLPSDAIETPQRRDPALRAPQAPRSEVWAALASLKLTVALLSMLVFLVFAGTLAQVHHDVWYVVDEGYFRVWWAWIELQTLPTLLGVFKPNNIVVDGGFYFPGGYLIGAAMVINLLAAHSLRYKVVARGTALKVALALLGAGVAATWWVISRALQSGEQASITPEFAELLWNLVRGLFAGVALGASYLLSLAWGRIRAPEWFVLAVLNGVLLAVAAYLFLDSDWRINDAGMRIVWQLLQSGIAGGLLMASAWLLFAKRAGVVLLHIGIALLMGHEFYVGQTNVESNMMIAEGETVDWTYDTRSVELAVIDRSDDDVDHVTVIPGRLLSRAAESEDTVISDPQLPVDVRVESYFPNASIAPRKGGSLDDSFAEAGKWFEVEPIAKGNGVKGAVDLPAAVVELLDKESGESLGKLLVTNFFDKPIATRLGPVFRQLPGFPGGSGEQVIDTGDGPLAIALRYKRIFKPYSMLLEDFAFDRFAGTDKPKNFSSDVVLRDPVNESTVKAHISMNNPLRYNGETFYQSEYDPNTEAGTVLQVVENEGWMVPYIGCAIVAVGMLVHFGFTLSRFADRRLREGQRVDATTQDGWLSPAVIVPVLFGLVAAGYLGSKLRMPDLEIDKMSLNAVASLPVLDQGRVKPLDSVARNTLQILSSRQEAYTAYEARKEQVPAIQWLMDVAAGRPEARKYYVFRITNLELLDTLDLTRRPGFFRYSVEDLKDSMAALGPQLEKARDVEEKMRTPFQRDVVDLVSKISMYKELMDAFSLPRSLSQGATQTDFAADRETLDRLRTGSPVRGVVPATTEGEWRTLFEANLLAMIDSIEGRAPNAAALRLARVMLAYEQGDAAAYDKALAEYREMVATYEQALHDPANASLTAGMKTVEKLDTDRVAFETWFNAASPFYYCAVMYFMALIVSAIGWLVFPRTLGRSALAMLAVTLMVHTLAIAARVYISDRPPITNLYTTAICIGWAIVLGMLVFESIFKLGIGSFVASAVGFSTLLIAHYLGLDEDTFTVMQAVLDTQFWLSTHVLTINLGYATTMLAGCLGIVYVVAVHLLGLFDNKQQRKLIAMVYGSLCFAILFSFVGTVLGGLWADDSWGRFWGWDPKENGALMIVLWNAVALHARWGKMVGPRGLAMLAIVGNIVTAWSWFGVNQLSQGLHAYAFRDDLAFYLWWFFVSQIVLLVLAAIPTRDGSSRGQVQPA